MKQQPSNQMIRAFTLTELLVVMTIIAILAAALVPTVNNAMKNARRTACISNVGQISKLMFVGIMDTRIYPVGSLGPALNYLFTIPGFTNSSVDTKILRCPSDSGASAWPLATPRCFNDANRINPQASYVYADANYVSAGVQTVGNLRISQIASPSRKAVFFEPPLNSANAISRPQNQWHHNALNHGVIGFADQHSALMMATNINTSTSNYY